MIHLKLKRIYLKKTAAVFIILWFSLLPTVSALAQDAVDANGNPTGPTGPTGPKGPTGAPACTGAGCGQGVGQGENQGGPSSADLGADENGNLPEGVVDTRQGANQGKSQGIVNGTTATNSNTGSGSSNTIDSDTNNSSSATTNNTVADNTAATATATTGSNTQSKNTSANGITSGNASISATVVKTDNTATIGGTAGLSSQQYAGTYNGDYAVGFGAGTAALTGASGPKSYQLTNQVTGSNSTNDINVFTTLEELVEVQNDGKINNDLNVTADTGNNAANENTGNGSIVTGNANVAATLVNLLNTTIINGDLWITVADIFGNLQGNINIPAMASYFSGVVGGGLALDAGNLTTGSDSLNTIAVDIDDVETFDVTNDAKIKTAVNATANTGNNDTISNTGGGSINTGNASVAASNVTLANTTIEGGNWGLFVVNALNGFLGFLVGDNGSVKALSQDETIREITAYNDTTGANSVNTIAVTDEQTRTTTVDNDATITNTITALANTGDNDANRNTGQGIISTGDAAITASAINIANTTVKDGSLFIAVVNVFGDWFGELFYGGSSLAQAAASQAAANQEISLNVENNSTGSESTNTVDVDVDRSHTTTITNDADLEFSLTADVNTGGNRANKNTLGASIDTGNAFLAQYSRAVANVTGVAGPGGLIVNADFTNSETGFDSKNTIRADINDERIITITNNANLNTLLGSLITPALVNTGRNEANQNTIGGGIQTGNVNVDAVIANLVNKVLIALSGEGVEIDATFVNTLTGALSTNLNDLNAVRTVLATVLSDAVIDNIINLLLNTGANMSNENTSASLSGADGFSAQATGSGSSIATGDICVNGVVTNNANAFGINVDISQNVDNNTIINNDVTIDSTTGQNEQNRNTSGAQNNSTGTCAKLAQVPPDNNPPMTGGTITPPPVGGGSVNSTEVEAEDSVSESGADSQPIVAGVSSAKTRVGSNSILKRFPVAGSESIAKWLSGYRNPAWLYFLISALALAIVASYCDKKARQALVLPVPIEAV